MSGETRIFPEEFVPNIEGVPYHSKWLKANPVEAGKWRAYRDGCLAYVGNASAPVPPTMATKYGRALVAAGKEHVSVIDLGADYGTPDPEPPPPNPQANPYFTTPYASGAITYPPMSTVFYNGSFAGSGPGVGNGFIDMTQAISITQSPDGRVSIVDDPGGSGVKVLRCEIRDSDPGWPVSTDVQKAEVRVSGGQETWTKPTLATGDERWFGVQMYCPYTASEKFEVAQNSNDWNVYLDLHSTGNLVSATSLGPWGSLTNQKMYFRCDGGAYQQQGTPNYEEITCWNILDSSGNPILSNFNRWINLVWGQHFAPDNTGWMEVWVDGINVYPRKNRPTMWTQDAGTGVYIKHGMYNSVAANYPVSGRSVVYYKHVKIGLTKQDVQ